MLEEITDTACELLRFKSAADTIPYAKEVAQYFGIGVEPPQDFGFWASVVHFEMRYRSLSYFLERTTTSNVLEISSGFSYRGLDFCQTNPTMRYVDTDLEVIVHKKKEILDTWRINAPVNFEIQSLDVKDFDTYPMMDGPVTILNEGLLLYFDKDEQERILKNIHRFLCMYGGTWATADIYLKHETDRVGSDGDKKWDAFFRKKAVKQHLFESFEQAEQFFFANGFEVIERYVPEFERYSGVARLFEHGTASQLEVLRNKGKVQETWHLKPIG